MFLFCYILLIKNDLTYKFKCKSELMLSNAIQLTFILSTYVLQRYELILKSVAKDMIISVLERY